jgi:hypothetical protein
MLHEKALLDWHEALFQLVDAAFGELDEVPQIGRGAGDRDVAGGIG